MDLPTIRDGSAPAQTRFSSIADLDEPTFWQRHRGLRWVLPLLALGVVAAGSAQLRDSGSSQDALPATTPDALLAAVRTPTAVPYSGTLVSRLSDDLPELPSSGVDDTVLTGSHTMRVWYGGPQQQRIAVLAATSETDVFRDGRDVWHWNTTQKQARHVVLPSAAVLSTVPTAGGPLGLTPQSIAEQALAAVDQTTTVVLGPSRIVADRPAYDLVVTPNNATTKIGSVRITVDGRRMVPLGVQVFARGENVPSVDVAYTGISFRRPDAGNFRFTPPAGVSVADVSPTGTVVAGSGWTSVLGYPDAALPLTADPSDSTFVAVSGSWGSGRLFESELMSLLVRADGTVFAGAVEPSLLYAAARSR